MKHLVDNVKLTGMYMYMYIPFPVVLRFQSHPHSLSAQYSMAYKGCKIEDWSKEVIMYSMEVVRIEK